MSKVAVIVGAGQGIGAATARKFAKEGYSIALVSRTQARLDKIKAELEKEIKGSKVLAVATDSTNRAQVEAGLKQIREKLGEPEVIIYNTGGELKRAPFLEHSVEDFHDQFNLAVTGAVLIAQQVLPSMIKNKRGTIIFTGATASVRGSAFYSSFATGKFALRALSQSLAREFGPQGVHVAHIIVDAIVDTEYTKETDKSSPDAIADTYWHLHAQHHTSWTYELDVRPDVEKW